MTKTIRFPALAVLLAGAAYLSTPAYAAEEQAACSVATMIEISDDICGGGSFTITNIQSSGNSCSWTLTCHAS